MVKRDDFAALVKRLAGGRSVRAVAKEVGISHTAIYEMLDGWVPSYRLLERFADGMKLDATQRGALFASAGYGREDAEQHPMGDPILAGILETARTLKPEQRQLVLQVARQFAGSVRQPVAAGCA